MSYTTRDKLKQVLGISGTLSGDLTTGYLDNLILRSDKLIEKVVGRRLEREEFTEYFDGNGSRFLELSRGPILSDVSTALVLSDVSYSSTGLESLTTVSAGRYFIRGKHTGTNDDWRLPCYLENYASIWTRGQRNYKVVYWPGWSTIPEDVEHAALFACSWMKEKRKDVAVDNLRLNEGVTVRYREEGTLVRELEALLGSYIDPRV